jgi:cob(I)alamin adenosyltransferase
MSIATRKGDGGETALMYNRRVSKCDPRVDAYGSVDELNAALGLARATVEDRLVAKTLRGVQEDLVHLMGELATAVEDLERYARDGYRLVVPEMTGRLDDAVREMESRNLTFKGWATPGETRGGAALDVARTVCRRAERRVCALQEEDALRNGEILVYLNRLSDVLWLLARQEEGRSAGKLPDDRGGGVC